MNLMIVFLIFTSQAQLSNYANVKAFEKWLNKGLKEKMSEVDFTVVESIQVSEVKENDLLPIRNIRSGKSQFLDSSAKNSLDEASFGFSATVTVITKKDRLKHVFKCNQMRPSQCRVSMFPIKSGEDIYFSGIGNVTLGLEDKSNTGYEIGQFLKREKCNRKFILAGTDSELRELAVKKTKAKPQVKHSKKKSVLNCPGAYPAKS